MSSSKRSRHEPQQQRTADRRSVIVNSDQARSHIADLATFIDGIEKERDQALSKVDDLESNVAQMESDVERIPGLENDVAYWKNNGESQKTAKENFEMELRKNKEEIHRLNVLGDRNSKDTEHIKRVLKSKDGVVENLTQENLKFRNEVARMQTIIEQQKGEIAHLQLSVHEQNAECQKTNEKYMAEADRATLHLSNSQNEVEELKVSLLESERNCETLENNLRASEAKHGTHDAEITKLKQEGHNNEIAMGKLPKLFIDAYTLDFSGTGYLLGTGRMLSLKSIAKSW
jgi:chromosome segregation ATPase